MVTLSETLHYELALRGAKVKVSVPCPGWVSTRIADSERNRPVELQTEFARVTRSLEEEAAEKLLRQGVAGGLPPELVADQVLEAIRTKSLHLHPYPERTVNTNSDGGHARRAKPGLRRSEATVSKRSRAEVVKPAFPAGLHRVCRASYGTGLSSPGLSHGWTGPLGVRSLGNPPVVNVSV